MVPGLDATQARERDGQPDGSVAAHAEVANVVEKDHAGRAGGILGWNEQGADQHVGSARFVDHGGAKGVVLGAQHLQLIRHAAATEVRGAINDDTRGLSTGVGIHHSNNSGTRSAHGVSKMLVKTEWNHRGMQVNADVEQHERKP